MYGHRGRSSSSDPYWLYALYVWQTVIWHHLTCKLQLATVQVGSDSMENGSGRFLSCCWFTPPEVKTLTANVPFLSIDSPRIQWSWRNPYHGELTWSAEAGQGTVPETRTLLYPHLMWTSGGVGKYDRWAACLIQALPFALKISAFPQRSRNKNMHVVLHV